MSTHRHRAHERFSVTSMLHVRSVRIPTPTEMRAILAGMDTTSQGVVGMDVGAMGVGRQPNVPGLKLEQTTASHQQQYSKRRPYSAHSPSTSSRPRFTPTPRSQQHARMQSYTAFATAAAESTIADGALTSARSRISERRPKTATGGERSKQQYQQQEYQQQHQQHQQQSSPRQHHQQRHEEEEAEQKTEDEEPADEVDAPTSDELSFMHHSSHQGSDEYISPRNAPISQEELQPWAIVVDGIDENDEGQSLLLGTAAAPKGMAASPAASIAPVKTNGKETAAAGEKKKRESLPRDVATNKQSNNQTKPTPSSHRQSNAHRQEEEKYPDTLAQSQSPTPVPTLKERIMTRAAKIIDEEILQNRPASATKSSVKDKKRDSSESVSILEQSDENGTHEEIEEAAASGDAEEQTSDPVVTADATEIDDTHDNDAPPAIKVIIVPPSPLGKRPVSASASIPTTSKPANVNNATPPQLSRERLEQQKQQQHQQTRRFEDEGLLDILPTPFSRTVGGANVAVDSDENVTTEDEEKDNDSDPQLQFTSPIRPSSSPLYRVRPSQPNPAIERLRTTFDSRRKDVRAIKKTLADVAVVSDTTTSATAVSTAAITKRPASARAASIYQPHSLISPSFSSSVSPSFVVPVSHQHAQDVMTLMSQRRAERNPTTGVVLSNRKNVNALSTAQTRANFLLLQLRQFTTTRTIG